MQGSLTERIVVNARFVAAFRRPVETHPAGNHLSHFAHASQSFLAPATAFDEALEHPGASENRVWKKNLPTCGGAGESENRPR
jgi:hypothetical protein